MHLSTRQVRLEDFPALEEMLFADFELVERAGDLDVWVRSELVSR